MNRQPKSVKEAISCRGVRQAGGTDVQDRIRKGLLTSSLVDLHRINGLRGIGISDGRIKIGSMTTIHAMANAEMLQGHTGLIGAASGLATPQIRRVATLGGNLLQEVRCAYLRSGQFQCIKTGGEGCPSRAGINDDQVAFDVGGCVAPNPSTMALAMLCWNATVMLATGNVLELSTIYPKHGRGPTHLLSDNDTVLSLSIDPVVAGEKSAWVRYAQRMHAEWPLVETVVRIVPNAGTIQKAFVAVGGVSVYPMRLFHLEEKLVGMNMTATSIEKCAELATALSMPLPQTKYKLPLMIQCIKDAFVKAMRG